jgi:perosamine synthetase
MIFANKHNLKVLEDAAPAIGAKCNDKLVATYGSASVFSFQGAKMMVTGEGGIVLTNDDEIFAKIKQYSEHGRSRDPSKTFWIETIGYKYKMSNIQAALGLAQFERLDELISKKREIFSWYENRLSQYHDIKLNKEANWAHSIYWMTSINLINKSMSRDALMKKMKEDNIDTRPVFPTISKYPMWYSDCDNPIATAISENSINLPSGHNLSKDDINLVCDSIIKNLNL